MIRKNKRKINKTIYPIVSAIIPIIIFLGTVITTTIILYGRSGFIPAVTFLLFIAAIATIAVITRAKRYGY